MLLIINGNCDFYFICFKYFINGLYVNDNFYFFIGYEKFYIHFVNILLELCSNNNCIIENIHDFNDI